MGVILQPNMQSLQPIYLDYNATTPVDPLVLEAMLPYFSTNFGNAASKSHFYGRAVAETVEACRNKVSAFIGCEPGELIFTSGATESINLAIKGIAEAYAEKGKHIITWETEHKAVLDVCSRLALKGWTITRLPVNREGLPDEDVFRNALRADTVLSVMMLANNETGVIQPVGEFARIAREQQCLFFCDATQAPGKIVLNVNDLNVDALCISAHKMYGPKGTGGLFLRRKDPRVNIIPQMDGGGHENGRRSGTLNVPGIVGFAKACELATENYWENSSRLSALRTLLEQILTTNGRGYVNGSVRNRIMNTTNIYFPGIKAEMLLTKIPELAVATGSACSSALPEPSHVLKAMGLNDREAYASIRFSLGRMTTETEINAVAKLILQHI